MDRFLAITPVGKSQLQILAAACLLLASKLREPSVRGLPADLLVFYTDNSITRRDLIVSWSHFPDSFSSQNFHPNNMLMFSWSFLFNDCLCCHACDVDKYINAECGRLHVGNEQKKIYVAWPIYSPIIASMIGICWFFSSFPRCFPSPLCSFWVFGCVRAIVDISIFSRNCQ